MTKITNYIQFDGDNLETASGNGLVSTLDRDMEIRVIPFASENEKAPSHRIFAKSPRGYEIDVGAIWKAKSQRGKDYFTLTIKPLGLKANLGRYPQQDDETLQSIIEWEPRD